jgi:hypothetical protein
MPADLPRIARSAERGSPVRSLSAPNAVKRRSDASRPCLLEVETAPAGIGQEFEQDGGGLLDTRNRTVACGR